MQTEKEMRDALLALAEMRDASAKAGTAESSKDERAEWDRYDAAERVVREALAAPAEGVDVEELRKIADGIDPKIGTMGCAETARRIRSMIDSAGGANGECCVPDAGEPSFVFLGRDPQAPALVEQWADERERAEPDSAKPAAARDIARRMREFKNANPDKGMPASAVIAQPAKGDEDKPPCGFIKVRDAVRGVVAVSKVFPGDIIAEEYETRPAATAVVPNIDVGVDVSSDGIDVIVVLRDGSVDKIIHHEHHALAAAAPAAPATAVVTDGWQLVPRIITPEMEDAADMRDDDEPLSDWGKVRDASRQAIWDAMLAAAPAAPRGGMDESKELLDAKVIDSLIVANEEWQAVAAKLAACLSDAIAGECPIPLFHASSAALQGYAALATGEQP